MQRLEELFWFISILFGNTKKKDVNEVDFAIMKFFPRKKKYIYWCGHCIFKMDTDIYKCFREKQFTRYTIRYHQAIEFKYWLVYYIEFIIQFIKGNPLKSIKGAYYTNPFIIESLFYENSPESIYFMYPKGRWKKFILKDRQKIWRDNKNWKTWIKNNYGQGVVEKNT